MIFKPKVTAPLIVRTRRMSCLPAVALSADPAPAPDNASAFDRLLTVEQLAPLIAMSPNAIRVAVSRGALPYYRLGRRTRFALDEVLALFKHVAPATTVATEVG